MDQEAAIQRLEDLGLALSAALEELSAQLPEQERKALEAATAKAKEAVDANLAKFSEAIVTQCAAIRVELRELAEKKLEPLVQDVAGSKFAALAGKLREIVEAKASSTKKEFAAKENALEETIAEVRRELAALPPQQPSGFANRLLGNWDKEKTYVRDDLFTFRGSTYLVLREARGIMPTQTVQRGPNPYYACVAAAGAPGPRGVGAEFITTGLNGYNAQSNNSGNSNVAPVRSSHTEIITVGGAARTSVAILATSGRSAGDFVVLRLNLPATSAIVLEVRNATSVGTLLTSITTDGSGDDLCAEYVFDGSAWSSVRTNYPA